MTPDKTTRQNRVREALGKIYDQHPPYFREYLRRFQEDPTSRVFAPLAEAYRRLGRVDEAIEICQEGLEHHPDFHGGRVALAKCFLDKRRYAEAKQELERVVQSVPENLLAQRLLGDAHLALKQTHSALHCYKMALMLSPNDVSLAEKVHQLERQDLSAPAPEPGALADSADSEVWDDELPASPAERGELSTSAAPGQGAQLRDTVPTEVPPKDPFTDEEYPTADLQAAEETDGPSPIDQLLGATEEDEDEGFRIEHVSAIFEEMAPQAQKEITTETLGDLYFSQGQFDRALRIFEKLQSRRPMPELMRKMNNCRMRLGVDHERVVLQRKIEALRTVLRRVHLMKAATIDPR